jgi:hypothetical protein
MTRTVEFAAQYILPGEADNDQNYTDLSTHASTAEANSAIEDNILSWQIAQHQGQLPGGRPVKYQVIRREITEEVVAVREDDGRSLLAELGREETP